MAKTETTKRRASGSRRGGTPGAGVEFPGWVAPLLFGVVTLVLFREFVFGDAMLYGGDTLSLGYMAREFFAEAVTERGVFPRWNPLILGGTPFLESLAGGDTLYPTSLLLFVLEPYRALGWKLVLHVFLAGVFMYGWVRTLGRSRPAALVAGLAYTVAPFLVTLVHPGHDGKLFVTALTPLLFLVMERSLRRGGLRPLVWVALVVALVILTTHFQLAYFLFGAAGVYYLVRVIVEARRPGAGDGGETGGRARPVTSPASAAARYGLFLVASVAGASAAGIQLVPAFDYVTEFSRRTATTTRADAEANRAYASSWSLHPEEAVSFVVPEFAGNDAGGADWMDTGYWGRNPFKDNHEYAGWVVLLLAVAGFFGMAGRGIRWTLAGIGVVAVLYALGTHTPVWPLFYALLPGVSLFRAPSMVSFLFGFAAVTLAAYGVDRLRALAAGPPVPGVGGAPGAGEGKGSGEGGSRALVVTLWALAGVVGVGMLLAAGGALVSIWTSVLRPDIDPGNLQALQAQQPYIVRGFFIATFLAVGVAGLATAARAGRIPRGLLVAGLALLVFIDGFRVSAPFVQTLDFYDWARPDPIVRELVERQGTEEPFRVVSLERAAQEVKPAIHGLELATGHHPNDLARYRELIGMEGSGMPRHILEPNVFALLNVRYLIWPDAAFGGPAQGLEPLLRTQLGGQVYQSLYALPGLPRARLVSQARVVADEEAVEVIRSEGFDPSVEAVLADPAPLELGGGIPQGTVAWEERGLNRQRLRVSTDRNALLVVADNWFPGWKARVDGEEVSLLRAYHTLRAVPVPAGEHTVEIVYDRPLLEASLGLSVATLLLLGAVAVVTTLRGRRERSPGA